MLIDRPILGMSCLLTLALFLSGSRCCTSRTPPASAPNAISPPPTPSAVGFAAYPFQLDTSSATFTPRTSEIGRLQETLLIAEEDTRFNPFRDPSDLSGISTPQQSKRSYTTTVVFYRSRGENVFTKERLEAIKMVRLSRSRADREVCGNMPAARVIVRRRPHRPYCNQVEDKVIALDGYEDVCLRGQNGTVRKARLRKANSGMKL